MKREKEGMGEERGLGSENVIMAIAIDAESEMRVMRRNGGMEGRRGVGSFFFFLFLFCF